MLKRRQDGPPKFPIFLKKRQKILALTVLGPRCLLEASKRPPRPSQEPPRATQEPPRAAQEPPKRRPRVLKRHLSPDMGASWAQGARSQVWGVRCQVPGVKCQVSSVRIKCSICSYQCDNWYVSNWRFACHINFSWEGLSLSLLKHPYMLQRHCTKLRAAYPSG